MYFNVTIFVCVMSFVYLPYNEQITIIYTFLLCVCHIKSIHAYNKIMYKYNL